MYGKYPVNVSPSLRLFHIELERKKSRFLPPITAKIEISNARGKKKKSM